MRIFTSRFGNRGLSKRDDLVKISIALGSPRWALPYQVDANLRCLAPEGGLFHVHDREQFKEMYYDKMDAIGVKAVYQMLEDAAGGRDIVLLCFEDLRGTGKWCHRRVFAEWWLERTGESIEDLEPVMRQSKMF